MFVVVFMFVGLLVVRVVFVGSVCAAFVCMRSAFNLLCALFFVYGFVRGVIFPVCVLFRYFYVCCFVRSICCFLCWVCWLY